MINHGQERATVLSHSFPRTYITTLSSSLMRRARRRRVWFTWSECAVQADSSAQPISIHGLLDVFVPIRMVSDELLCLALQRGILEVAADQEGTIAGASVEGVGRHPRQNGTALAYRWDEYGRNTIAMQSPRLEGLDLRIRLYDAIDGILALKCVEAGALESETLCPFFQNLLTLKSFVFVCPAQTATPTDPPFDSLGNSPP